MYTKLIIEESMNIGIKLIAMCATYDYTDLGYIGNLNLKCTTLQKK